jgi:hypothetical protein
MIPLRDLNPTVRRPIVTVVLIVACAAVYFLIEPAGRLVTMHPTTAASRQEADAFPPGRQSSRADSGLAWVGHH